MFSLGIDIGYSSVKVSLFEDAKRTYNRYELHRGRVREVLLSCLRNLPEAFLSESAGYSFGAVTGSGSRIISDYGMAVSVNETAATIEGVKLLEKNAGSIIEIGGESATYITGIKPGCRHGVEVSMNSNCSAGTGSFLEEQVSRMALRL